MAAPTRARALSTLADAADLEVVEAGAEVVLEAAEDEDGAEVVEPAADVVEEGALVVGALDVVVEVAAADVVVVVVTAAELVLELAPDEAAKHEESLLVWIVTC